MCKKGENIYKRKDNRWEARYIKEYLPDGTTKFGYCYGKSYKEAKEKLLKAKIESLKFESNKFVQNEIHFSKYCEEWLLLKRNQVKESTYVKYTSALEKYIKPQLGNFSAQTLSINIIESFSNYLITEKRLSAKTVKDILNIVNSILKHINKVSPNLIDNIEIAYPKRRTKEMRVLTIGEQQILLKYLLKNTDNYKFGTILALITGMRIGEICALKWKDICLNENTIKVSSTMQRIMNTDKNSNTKTKIIISQPKSENSFRIIPLTGLALDLCKKYYCNNPEAFVLTSQTDKFIEPRIMQSRFSSYTKELGLHDVHFHTLRHTFATRCVEMDFEIKTLSEILGHSSPKITLERYVHTSLQLKINNMKKLQALGF